MNLSQVFLLVEIKQFVLFAGDLIIHVLHSSLLTIVFNDNIVLHSAVLLLRHIF